MQVQAAWNAYLHDKLAKGLPEDERPRQGQEEAAWARIEESAKDSMWKAECLKRDEKFDRHLKAAVRSNHSNFERLLLINTPLTIESRTCRSPTRFRTPTSRPCYPE